MAGFYKTRATRCKFCGARIVFIKTGGKFKAFDAAPLFYKESAQGYYYALNTKGEWVWCLPDDEDALVPRGREYGEGYIEHLAYCKVRQERQRRSELDKKRARELAAAKEKKKKTAPEIPEQEYKQLSFV